MRIKVVELLDNITAAAVDQDVDKLLELKSKLKAVELYIQSPNVQPRGFIQIVDVILRLLPDAPDLDKPEISLEVMRDTRHGMAFDVGWALFGIAEATQKQDRAGLRKIQIDFRSIEELIHGKLNEPPSAFVKLIDALLEILPGAEVKTDAVVTIEESNWPAESMKRIEEPQPDPAATGQPQKRSFHSRLWKN